MSNQRSPAANPHPDPGSSPGQALPREGERGCGGVDWLLPPYKTRLMNTRLPTHSPASAELDRLSNVPSPDALAMIERLIAFDTTSRESNLGLIEWARDYLERLGAKTRLTYDAKGIKANLFATLGEGSKPGMILSGHTDTVPVDGQEWKTDPFVPTIVGDKSVRARFGRHEGLPRRRAASRAALRRRHRPQAASTRRCTTRCRTTRRSAASACAACSRTSKPSA